ncbi:hypothetical protein TTHERM_00927310 (macronuclear) [Tetrahymena thermophila SB210]|uniref:Uncharacterized protein n=1 Tax=Tetrahymena thermophila (strain SB210) TaxID=312017 RepID=Q22DS9_TETTS|nr:hypothetical protein TTHERM_00927310 [Tetrahymena thermophila SB210]EAR83476.2 hypothetical protein TTHERM_00927310 [Tetrahymena thermophila SB210]|eukprot:XP_001031139.2 hypothetical protein TTHERM_00927310 [Tetrahymena thermophila SB210]
MGLLNRDLMTNISYESVVSWEDQTPERYSPNQALPNILLQSDFRLKDYCQIKEKCGQDQQCLNNFDNYLLQFDKNRNSVQYYKTQWNTWSYHNQNLWENLELEQKHFIIKSSLQLLFASSYVENQYSNYAQANAIYGARNKDGLLIGQYTSYGGPFYCMKVNGQYPEFKYTNIDQFNGFQYMDQAGQVCGNQSKPCSCSYFNIKRMYPIDWRCRPWYLSANNTYYMQFQHIFTQTRNSFEINTSSYSQPYTNILLGIVSITCTFKVVIPRQQIHSIEDELNFQSDAILAIDINLGELQKRFMKNDTQTQYSYLLSTNTDKTVSNFTPLLIRNLFMMQNSNQMIQVSQKNTKTKLIFQWNFNKIKMDAAKYLKTMIQQHQLQKKIIHNIQQCFLNYRYALEIQMNKKQLQQLIMLLLYLLTKEIKIQKVQNRLLFTISTKKFKTESQKHNMSLKILFMQLIKQFSTLYKQYNKNQKTMTVHILIQFQHIKISLKNYEQALNYMNESEKNSCSIFEQFTQSIMNTQGVDQIKIITFVCEQGQNIPLLEIYACRKFYKSTPKKNKRGGDEKQIIDIKMYLRQAQDLLSDSHQIFLLISNSHKINVQEKQKEKDNHQLIICTYQVGAIKALACIQ